jgi:transcriptional regulator with XRE-family HTH domain
VPKKSRVGFTVESLGSYLREQRVAAELSLRQLAEQAGVSNPYLSQIERGLRRPSAEVLQALAKALRISAEQVYVQAGILNPDDDEVRSVELAILGDPVLSERQKQALLEVYESFRAVSVLTDAGGVPEQERAQEPAQEPAHDVPLADEAHDHTDVRTGDAGQATPTEGA